MDAVVDELVTRGLGNAADAASALRQLRGAFRKSTRFVDAAATRNVFSRLYEALPSVYDQTAERWPEVATERLHTLMTFAEQRASSGSTLDGSVSDATDETCVAQRLATLSAARLTAAAARCGDAPVTVNVGAAVLAQCATALQTVFGCVCIATATSNHRVWLAVIAALVQSDIAAGVGDILDRLRLQYCAIHGSKAERDPVLVGALATASRLISALVHSSPPPAAGTTDSGAADRETRQWRLRAVSTLTRRLLESSTLMRLCDEALTDTRLAIAAADAFTDVMAVWTVVRPIPHEPLDVVALTVLADGLFARVQQHVFFTPTGLTARDDVVGACVQEATALLTAWISAAVELEPTSPHWLSVAEAAARLGPGAVLAIGAAAGERHAAVLAAGEGLGGVRPPLEIVKVPATHDHPAVHVASLALPMLEERKVEAQIRLRGRSGRDIRCTSFATVHQWIGGRRAAPKPTRPFQPPDPRGLDSFISTFGEPFPKSGRVNHSKPVAHAVCRLAPRVLHPSQLSSDRAPESASPTPAKCCNVERSSWALAFAQPDESRHWAFDVQVHCPAAGSRENETTVVVSVAATGESLHVVELLDPRSKSHAQFASTRAESFHAASAIEPVSTPRPRQSTAANVGPYDASDGSSLLQALAKAADDEVDDDQPASVAAQLAARRTGTPTESSSSSTANEFADARHEAARLGGSPTSVGIDLVDDNRRLRLLADETARQRDDAVASVNTLRHTLELQDQEVVAPLMAEVSELRRLCARYEAALEACSHVIRSQAAEVAQSEADATRVNEEMQKLYVAIGLGL
jgi:hypothetical protein